jgi:hypothetical protein
MKKLGAPPAEPPPPGPTVKQAPVPHIEVVKADEKVSRISERQKEEVRGASNFAALRAGLSGFGGPKAAPTVTSPPIQHDSPTVPALPPVVADTEPPPQKSGSFLVPKFGKKQPPPPPADGIFLS